MAGESMIERVAKALFKEATAGIPDAAWNDDDDDIRAHYMGMARAAITAMRSATAEMIGGAGAVALNKYIGADPRDSYFGTATWADECWTAMIDAASPPDTLPREVG